MKPALLKILAIVLIGALVFLGGWLLYHGGWEKLKEDWTGKYRERPNPSRGALALGPDGYYWGVTSDSTEMPGYLYKMKADGSGWRIVHTFLHNESPISGIYPEGSLVSDGVDSLLGTTVHSVHSSGFGTLYKVNATTGVLTTLMEFKGKSGSEKGSGPCATLVHDGMGSFWGSTRSGGTNHSGTIFKYSLATGVLTTVADITTSAPLGFISFGPSDALASDGHGYLWGITCDGGKENGGTVFKVHESTGELTVLREFNDAKGGQLPVGGLVSDDRGFLWGTCSEGGKFGGTIFKVNATTGALTTVVEFTDVGGSNPGNGPRTALVGDGHGFLWGSTLLGGRGKVGTIFKVDIASGVLTTVMDFGISGPTHKGYFPQGTLVIDGHGAFLGNTLAGGAKNAGTIFKIDIATGVLTTLVEVGKVGP